MKRRLGTVYLVGAGPGDPKLLTLRGAELLRQADVVVADALVNPALLALAPTEAEILRRPPKPPPSAAEITELLIQRARDGRSVVRLKGGDPYVFGRGGEEATALRKAKVPFEVVPGVTSALAVPAAAGIPLTQRGIASSFTVVTGHEDPAKGEEAVDYAQLANAPGTRVILMGAARIRPIAARLQQHGLPAKTPVAMIRTGTTPQQQTLVGTLGTIADQAEAAGIQAPVVTVIGEVVAQRKKLDWFEARPLFGRRVVVTRARAQAEGMIQALEALGAEVLPVPSIRTAPPADVTPLGEAILGLNGYDWVAFTSANGVEQFFGHFFKGFQDLRDLGGVRVAAVGPATAAKLRELHLQVDLTPKQFEANRIARELGRLESMENRRILLLRAEVATPDLPRLLEDQGAIVDDIACYRTVAETEIDPRVEADLRKSGADWLTFTSGSTVRHFHARFDLPELCHRFPDLRCATIGPETSAVLREIGAEPAVEASPHTVDGIIAGLSAAAKPRRRSKASSR